MELEDQIFHLCVLLCAVGIFFPWFGGQWFGTPQTWSGLSFYTGYIGRAVLLIQLYILAIVLSPMVGGPILIKAATRRYVRLVLSAVSTMLLVACFTVLVRVTFEVSGADVRFGIYFCMIASLVATFYAFLRYRQQQKAHSHEHFMHPDELPAKRTEHIDVDEQPVVPPPPPPPPLPPEDHHPFPDR